jgi:amphi-Trp domain-containing protein
MKGDPQMTKEKFKIKGTVEMQEIINHLEEILNSFKTGRVVLEHGTDHMEFAPGNTAEMEVEAKQKDGKKEFSVEFTWRDDIGIGEKLDLKILSEASVAHAMHKKSRESERAGESAHIIHPEEELRHYQGTEAFGLELDEEYGLTQRH